jgi:hypothetical protein
MSNPELNPQEPLKCPICGKPAEKGCLYGADTAPLQWIGGQASLTKNVAAAIGQGEAVGRYGLLPGRYAEGIRCSSCRRIILEYGPPA